MIKLIKKRFISASIFITLGLLSAIAARYLENAPSSVPLVISLMMMAGGLWMALRPKSIAKNMQDSLDKREAYIRKRGQGEFFKQLEESGGYKNLSIEMSNPKHVRNWGIIAAVFGLTCAWFFYYIW
jgi:hypothetical protein